MADVTTIGSKEARVRLRDLLDAANRGSETVIERNGRPVATLIPYEAYHVLQEEIADWRAAQRAAEVYEAWRRDHSVARPFEEFESELIAEGKLGA